MLNRISVVAFMFVTLCLPDVASAGFLDDAVNIVTAPIRAPIQATQDIIHGRPPGEILQNQINTQIGPQVNIGQQVITVVDRGQNIISQIPRDIIQNSLGNDWLRGYDFLTASQRVQFEAGLTAGRFLGNCTLQVRNCNPLQMAAIPVAAGMRDAYRVYATYAQPLSPFVVQVLSPVVPPQVLMRAKWVVGNMPDLTIPGFLNAGHSVTGSQHAVTLGNVMVFSTMPDLSSPSGWIWLLHELFHSEQYLRYSSEPLESIDGFAVDYIQGWNAMENEAESNAQARFNIRASMPN